MTQPIYINSWASISALGSNPETIWQAYLDNNHYLKKRDFNQYTAFVGRLADEDYKLIENIKKWSP
mgnify:CR=1 FL=1